ncbi:amidohydrolase family protein [Algoriphagus halophytocola]|uniref:Amidohydrolase family protein n=1 Tax=Algoriphagus halophytocola TaxID=2991499 RepID=A0ABY6MIR8_9BACT|nr:MULTISPECIES: amidohydrolase family protein [unclassified Algoriphagus]UZD22874.1 amidohydrolase family protein [Algoriphagus sp. TR-M5]WBL44141.1 amidohydrolase family protein [Algoriphagus sp. TR-M9]
MMTFSLPRFLLFSLFSVFLSLPLTAQNTKETNLVISNVEIFDGINESTFPGSVWIQGNKIKQVSTNSITLPADVDATEIDGQGMFLMPGLIDAHYHTMFATLPQVALLTSDIGFVNLAAGRNAEAMLQRGFTSVRDLGGPVFGLKKAIDAGIISGPRIFPSGAFLSQTGGHGDFRLPYEVPADGSKGLSYSERINAAAIADGADEVLKRTREQLMLGASQIKLMAGGGVSSVYDPLDVSQYTVAEFRAAVDAAENWGTYVTVHAYTPRAIQNAIQGGVKCIDHGQLIDEETAQLMAEKGIWWSLQPFIEEAGAVNTTLSPESRAKQLEMYQGTDNAFALAKKYGIKTAWGTDVLFDASKAMKQGNELLKMKRWYSNFEILRMATSVNGELLALSGKRSPYAGKLGVIEEGALADILLIQGNLLEDLSLITKPSENLLLVIKDGKTYKNMLSSGF